MEVISNERAAQEVENWLSIKKISGKRREKLKDNIEELINLVSGGQLSIADDGIITQPLLFPLGNGNEIKELKFKPRLKGIDISRAAGINKGFDLDNFVISRLAALTDQNKEILKNLDTEDRAVSDAVTVFFTA